MNPRGDTAAGDLTGLRFKVTDLLRSPGSRSTAQRVVRPDALDDPDNLAGGEVRLVLSTPATVDVDMESLSGALRVSATVRFSWEGACRRCLGTAHGTATSEILELYVEDPGSYDGSEENHTGQVGVPGVDWEARELADGWVDLREPVRDAMLLGLPLAPLCSEDCAGPAPEDFPVELASDDATADGNPGGDPRWAALDELHFDPRDT